MKKIILILLFIIFGLSIWYISIPKTIMVEIKGEVINPGVFSMKVGSTVKDLIDKSGGVKDNVDLYTINLSHILDKGDVVALFNINNNENYDESYNKIITNLKNNKSIDNYITNEIWESSKISINDGLKEDLMELPGIGETKALSIIEYRNKNGRFKKIEDIINVKGIGSGLYEKIKDYIRV